MAASMYAGMSALYPSLMPGFDPLASSASPFYFPFGIGGGLPDPSSFGALPPTSSLFGGGAHDPGAFAAAQSMLSAKSPAMAEPPATKTSTPSKTSSSAHAAAAADVKNSPGVRSKQASRSGANKTPNSTLSRPSSDAAAVNDVMRNYETFLAKAMSELPPAAALQASLMASSSQQARDDITAPRVPLLSSQTPATLKSKVSRSVTLLRVVCCVLSLLFITTRLFCFDLIC